MINLVIKDISGRAYELTDRNGAPRASSAKRYSSDRYSTFRFVATLPLATDQWLRILNSSHRRLPNFHNSHPAAVHEAVAELVVCGELIIYQLPSLSVHHCLPGKKGLDLCIIKGPKPHSATELTPETLTSPQAVQQLLDELGLSSQDLVTYLVSEGLITGDQTQQAHQEALQLLASGALLAYKRPLPITAPPPKPVDYTPATKADQPVPLGPEGGGPGREQSTPQAVHVGANKNPPAQSIEECEQRLAAARERLIKGSYESKFTDEEVMAAAQKGELDDRFVVRLIKNYAKDNDYLGKMENGEVKYWSTTFNQMENADTDPQLLSQLFGIDYDPKGNYTLVVIDTHAKGAGQSTTIVPTHKNLGNFAKAEIKDINPDAVDQVMTPEYNDEYLRHMVAFNSEGLDINKGKDVNDYANANFSRNADKIAFKNRMRINKKLGANEHYTGNGTSKNLIKSCPDNKCGVMETFTYDKNPQTLANLEASGSAKRISAKPL